MELDNELRDMTLEDLHAQTIKNELKIA